MRSTAYPRLGRKHGLLGTTLLVGMASLIGTTYAHAGQLNVLTWQGYADKTFVKPFEKQTGCQVHAAYVGTNDAFVAKIVGGGTDYDVVSPSNDTTMRLIDADAVSPIDRSKVPNMKHYFKKFQNPPWDVKNGKLYGVPYGWGIMRIIVNGNKIPNPPDSLKLLWNPKYKGKVSLWDDVSAIWTAARYLGYKDVYKLTNAQLKKTQQALMDMKPNIRKYWFTTGEMGQLMESGEVWAGNAWETTIIKLREDGMNIIDVSPVEGRGGWSDSWMIVKGHQTNPCVYKWLNYNASAKAQALAFSVTGYGYANRNLVKYLNGKDKKNYHMLDLDNLGHLKNIQWWQPMGNRRKVYLNVWNQVKAQPPAHDVAILPKKVAASH